VTQVPRTDGLSMEARILNFMRPRSEQKRPAIRPTFRALILELTYRKSMGRHQSTLNKQAQAG
jgi:hypothetical protein